VKESKDNVMMQQAGNESGVFSWLRNKIFYFRTDQKNDKMVEIDTEAIEEILRNHEHIETEVSST
jgi:hypothetical protein